MDDRKRSGLGDAALVISVIAIGALVIYGLTRVIGWVLVRLA